MTDRSKIKISRFQRASIVFGLFLSGLLLAVSLSGAAEQTIVPPPTGIRAFHPGEILTYRVSWSNVFSAGTVTMAVETERLPDKREVFKFVVQGRTTGLLDKAYPVNDTVQSVFDPLLMQSLAYSLRESYGKKKRLRMTEFDHEHKTAVYKLNQDPPVTVTMPDPVQDGLSVIYYLRTKEVLEIGRHMEVDVLDSGKKWTVEIVVLAREKVETAAGKFDTIKIRTSSKLRGASVKKGEAFIWLTDDDRKVPVLMKSKIKVGSFVFELRDMQSGTRRFTQ